MHHQFVKLKLFKDLSLWQKLDSFLHLSIGLRRVQNIFSIFSRNNTANTPEREGHISVI